MDNACIVCSLLTVDTIIHDFFTQRKRVCITQTLSKNFVNTGLGRARNKFPKWLAKYLLLATKLQLVLARLVGQKLMCETWYANYGIAHETIP